jgi:glycyl-tRNA synthetase
MCGVHDRTDYDLTQHGKKSGKSLTAFNEQSIKEDKNEIPNIIEIAFGTDRPTFALLDIFYSKIVEQEGKTKFKIPQHMSPVKVAVFPLVKKDGLPDLAKKIYDELQKEFVVRYDISGSIGKRYLREDESGTAYCITVDYDSLTKEDVTIRNRDTEEQKRIPINTLKHTIRELLSYRLKWEDLK